MRVPGPSAGGPGPSVTQLLRREHHPESQEHYARRVTIYDILATSREEVTGLHQLGPFIRNHGVDLCGEERPEIMQRGTPVYVTVNADPVDVQRRMAEVHARMAFVLDSRDRVLGLIDMRDLAARGESLDWPNVPVTAASEEVG